MSTQKPPANTQELNFETAYAELENLVDRMEHGEQDLSQSLADFEQGISLMKHCNTLLKDAEQKVEVLISENQGMFKTEPFEQN